MNLLEIRNLKKHFPVGEGLLSRHKEAVKAVDGVSLTVEEGETLGIVGESGCGKSTLLSLIGLLDSPTEGEHWLKSEPVAKLSLADRCRIRNREIGFIFQAFNLIGDLTVYENTELPLTYRGMSAAERKKRVQNALERAEAHHPPE